MQAKHLFAIFNSGSSGSGYKILLENPPFPPVTIATLCFRLNKSLWKNILKGLYDIHRNQAQFIITGSARLDYFGQSCDSLVGQYFSFRMLPLGLAEAMGEMQLIINDDKLISDRKTEVELLSRLQDK